jgi:hypothetical protein
VERELNSGMRACYRRARQWATVSVPAETMGQSIGGAAVWTS